LDYADQRYYASAYGRFNTVDPTRINVQLKNPGSWNSYAYGNGDPAGHNDPSGRYVDSDSDGTSYCSQFPDDPECAVCQDLPDSPGCIGDGDGDQGQQPAAPPPPLPTCDDLMAGDLTEYFASHYPGSPLAGDVSAFVADGDLDDVDPRLLVALAAAESSLGKNVSTASHDAWGYLNKKGKLIHFSSWTQGISVIAARIGTYQFGKLGYTTEAQFYTGLTGSWCSGTACAGENSVLVGALNSMSANLNNLQDPCAVLKP